MESILKLTIEKGPRKGETLEFTSRSTIRIGRVVRGNNITIKDAGISSKHICIRFDCKWLLSDLDSSNGTFLNDIQLSPSKNVEVKDGDMIKLGEVTCLKVEMISGGGEEEKKMDVGKPPRRGRPKKVLNLNEIVDTKCDVVVKIEEMSEAPVSRQTRSSRNERIVKEPEKAIPAKRGGRCKRILQDDVVSENLDEECSELPVGVDSPIKECAQDREKTVNLPSEAGKMSVAAPVLKQSRSTRNSKKVESVDLSVNDNDLKEPEKAVPAKRGGRRKKIVQEDVVLENLDEEHTEIPVTVETLGNGNIEKSITKSVNLGEECGHDKASLPSEAVAMSIAAPMTRQTRSTRNTRNSKKAEHVDLSMNDSKKEAVPAKRGGRSKRILQDDLVSKNLEEERTKLPNSKEPERAQWGGKPKRILQKDPAAENLDEECIKSPARMENLGHENIAENSPIKSNLDAGKSVNLGDESKADEMDVSGEKNARTSNIGQKSAENVATSSGVKGKSVNVMEPPDLEKITLGEWFDYLEVALQKEIHDRAEEMILELRKTAFRVHQLRLQQKNAKP